MSVVTESLERIGPRRLVAAAAAVLLIGAGGWVASHRQSAPSPAPAVDGIAAPAAAASVLVFVSGAVVNPGLYQLSPDARVADAIAAAGGITSRADPGHLPNLAARVHDGRQVNVPFAKAGSSVAKLDINTATADELAAVPGMPPGLAETIVQYRDEWGPLTTVSELRTALGVDSATVAALGHYLRVVLPLP